MTESRTVTAGLCQFNAARGAIDDNVAAAESAIERAGEKGAALIVLPELWSCGYDNDNMYAHAHKTPQIVNQLANAASRHRAIIAGSLPEAAGEQLFNTLFVIDADGHIAARYRKVHLFPLMGEDRCFAPGNTAVVCPTSAGNLGLMICYDLRFPELARHLAVKGADIVIVCAQWPAARIAHWDVLLQARAIENQLFVIAANRCGSDSDMKFAGHSQMISPTGEIIAHAGNAVGETLERIDLNEIATCRNRFFPIAERVPAAYED
ncbi:MAG: carbon-nitrogen family hydrolase [Thermodesulfobacteriota bacterium]